MDPAEPSGARARAAGTRKASARNGSHWRDLNPRPADYESAALPAELQWHADRDERRAPIMMAPGERATPRADRPTGAFRRPRPPGRRPRGCPAQGPRWPRCRATHGREDRRRSPARRAPRPRAAVGGAARDAGEARDAPMARGDGDESERREQSLGRLRMFRGPGAERGRVDRRNRGPRAAVGATGPGEERRRRPGPLGDRLEPHPLGRGRSFGSVSDGVRGRSRGSGGLPPGGARASGRGRRSSPGTGRPPAGRAPSTPTPRRSATAAGPPRSGDGR